jgi:hypothetical protein
MPSPRAATAERLPDPPGELSPLERRFVEGEPRTPEEADEAFRTLAARALASPEGHLSFCGVPDDDS